MISKLFRKLGYVRIGKQESITRTFSEDDFSEDILALWLAKKLGVQDTIDTDYEKKIFADLKETDGLVQYLREAAARDKDRYFGVATKEEQLIIRGAFARTMYLKARISGTEPEKLQFPS